MITARCEDAALHGTFGRFVREEGRVSVVSEFVINGLVTSLISDITGKKAGDMVGRICYVL